MENAFEIDIYKHNDLIANKIKIYSFSNVEQVYQLVEKYIKFLQRNL